MKSRGIRLLRLAGVLILCALALLALLLLALAIGGR